MKRIVLMLGALAIMYTTVQAAPQANKRKSKTTQTTTGNAATDTMNSKPVTPVPPKNASPITDDKPTPKPDSTQVR